MSWDAIKKIVINFAVVFIIASVFSSVTPSATHKAYAFFEDKLGFGAPSIGSFEVDVDKNDNTQFVVKYSILSNNYGDIEKIIVSRSYGKSPDVKMSGLFRVEGEDIENPITLDGNNAPRDFLGEGGKIEGTENIEVDKKKADGSEDHISVGGVHRFTIEVFLSSGDVDSKDAEVMIYDDYYVELFEGGLSGCVKKGIAGDPISLRDCDVDAQKRVELEALSTGGGATSKNDVIEAHNNADVDRAKCKYEPSGWWVLSKYRLSDGCEPKEVNGVWREYLKIKGWEEDYNCERPLNSKSLRVCMVKRQVVMTLDKLGWEDLRANKGWEANV